MSDDLKLWLVKVLNSSLYIIADSSTHRLHRYFDRSVSVGYGVVRDRISHRRQTLRRRMHDGSGRVGRVVPQHLQAPHLLDGSPNLSQQTN